MNSLPYVWEEFGREDFEIPAGGPRAEIQFEITCCIFSWHGGAWSLGDKGFEFFSADTHKSENNLVIHGIICNSMSIIDMNGIVHGFINT